MRLDARYTLKTDDGHYIYIRSKGIFKPGPGVDIDPATRTRMTQDEVEWFTRLQFEASGPYDWMNSVFGIGVLAMDESKILIDAYELTNFMCTRTSFFFLHKILSYTLQNGEIMIESVIDGWQDGGRQWVLPYSWKVSCSCKARLLFHPHLGERSSKL